MKIRYKYRESKEGFKLKNVKCPVCKSNHINWGKIVQHKSWDGTIIMLAECWSGNTKEDKPHHLFLIEMEDLPVVSMKKIKKVKKPKPSSLTGN